MRTGLLHWSTTLKLLHGWYGSPLFSFITLGFICTPLIFSPFCLLQVMLYVDMEVNGVPLKVIIINFFLYAWLISLPLFLSLPLWLFKVQACTFILKSIIWCFKEKNYNFVLVSVCFCLWELFEKYFGIFLIIK